MKVASSIWTLFNKEREENECIGEESIGVVSPHLILFRTVFVWNLSLKKYLCHRQEVIKTACTQNTCRVTSTINQQMRLYKLYVVRRTPSQLHSLQQIPTQHDMLPQHLVYKNELNREYVINLTRKDETP